MPLLATETPRRLFFLFRERLLCARPCAELLLPDSRENAARASVKRPTGQAPQLREPSAHMETQWMFVGWNWGKNTDSETGAPED